MRRWHRAIRPTKSTVAATDPCHARRGQQFAGGLVSDLALDEHHGALLFPAVDHISDAGTSKHDALCRHRTVDLKALLPVYQPAVVDAKVHLPQRLERHGDRHRWQHFEVVSLVDISELGWVQRIRAQANA